MQLNKSILLCSLFAGLALGLVACSEDNPVDTSTTVITEEEVVENNFDKWLKASILEPYNVQIRYKLKDNESNMRYNLSPAEYSKSVQMAHLIKYLGFEVYDEVTGSKSFIRQLFPKLVDLVGSRAYNVNGTFVLGTAEGGRKMTLYMVNELDPTNVDALNEYYFKTLHHEFGHIQNQTKPYPQEFQQISATSYIADSWSTNWSQPTDIRTTINNELRASYPRIAVYDTYRAEHKTIADKGANATALERVRLAELETLIQNIQQEYSYKVQLQAYNKLRAILFQARDGQYTLPASTLNSLRAGFISPYASSQHGEDFVEIQSIFMTNTPEVWEAMLTFAGANGRNIIQQKYELVETYLANDWGISLRELRASVLNRQANLAAQDLNTLTIN